MNTTIVITHFDSSGAELNRYERRLEAMIGDVVPILRRPEVNEVIVRGPHRAVHYRIKDGE